MQAQGLQIADCGRRQVQAQTRRRTGRAGRKGDAISFVTPRERHLLRAIEKATRQPLTQMQMPTVEDINTRRLARFDAGITQALGSEELDFYRDVIGHYVNEYDVPEADVAAALAVVLQGDSPFMLDTTEEPVNAPAARATYRIAVGKRQKIGPRQIVGALANEGGLKSRDFGAIDIRGDHTLVELPATLPAETWKKLRKTRISGKLIELTLDTGHKPPREGGRKPRHDKPAHHKGRHKGKKR